MPRAEPIKRDGLLYTSWGGYFCDPEIQPELFSMLPGWRQREVLCIRNSRITNKRFPNEAELKLAVEGRSLPNLPASIPSILTFASLNTRPSSPPPSDSLLHYLMGVISQEAIVEYCTAFGQGETLSQQRPKHGLYAFIWMLARIRGGLEDAMPLTYFYDLEEGIEALTGQVVSTRVVEAASLMTLLDDAARILYRMSSVR